MPLPWQRCGTVGACERGVSRWAGRQLFVVHIEIEDTCIRIVSARRAEPSEESRYAE